MASAVGITDVGQLLDLAVANGIMTQEDADKLRAGIAAGALAKGLAQSGSGSAVASPHATAGRRSTHVILTVLPALRPPR